MDKKTGKSKGGKSKIKCYYAVRKGHEKGIYTDWNVCLKRITNFPDAKFKKFENLEDAEYYISDEYR